MVCLLVIVINKLFRRMIIKQLRWFDGTIKQREGLLEHGNCCYVGSNSSPLLKGIFSKKRIRSTLNEGT